MNKLLSARNHTKCDKNNHCMFIKPRNPLRLRLFWNSADQQQFLCMNIYNLFIFYLLVSQLTLGEGKYNLLKSPVRI